MLIKGIDAKPRHCSFSFDEFTVQDTDEQTPQTGKENGSSEHSERNGPVLFEITMSMEMNTLSQL